MTKAQEIQLLEEIKERVFKLINAKDGYIKDQLKELGSLDSIKDDFDRMCYNIKSDFMPLLGTTINRIIHINKQKQRHYMLLFIHARARAKSLEYCINDMARDRENDHTLLGDVLDNVLRYKYDAVQDNEDNELAVDLEKKFKEYLNVWVIETKIDMGLELLPDE